MMTRRAAILGLLAFIPTSVAAKKRQPTFHVARVVPYCHGDHPRHHRLHHKGQMPGHGQGKFRDNSMTWKGG